MTISMNWIGFHVLLIVFVLDMSLPRCEIVLQGNALSNCYFLKSDVPQIMVQTASEKPEVPVALYALSAKHVTSPGCNDKSNFTSKFTAVVTVSAMT